LLFISLLELLILNHKSQKQADKWNAEDYANNSSGQELWAKELIAKLSLNGCESVIDIGCGNGRITNTIACLLPKGDIIGIDLSENMIKLASKSYKRDNLSFYVMNATDISLEKKFDIAFSNATLHWVKNHQAVLKSLKKHLTPNAKILFQMGGKGNAQDIVDTLDNEISSKKWNEYFTGFEFPFYFYNIGDYEKWLPATGYKAVRIELIPKDMVHKNLEEFKGWLRTTWFPFINRIPETQHELFIDELVNKYIKRKSIDAKGRIHVNMARLEIEARVL
jgi:trans-aconitate 2-methyltransferase